MATNANDQTDPKATPAPDTEAEDANVADAQAEPPAVPVQPVTVILQQPDKPLEAARNMAAGKAAQKDKADTPGGRYIVNGQEVNANGDPVGTSLDKSRS